MIHSWCAKTEARRVLAAQEQLVPHSRCLVEGEQHGYSIMQDVLERSGGKVRLWPATLYGSLKRLIEKGLIAESGERPAPELDDARRRYYKLTPLGRQVLDLESQRLKDLVRVLDARRRQEARS